VLNADVPYHFQVKTCLRADCWAAAIKNLPCTYVQDFFGVMEEMRIWNVVRTPEEIRKGMEMDDGRGPGLLSHPVSIHALDACLYVCLAWP
jgi:hypothetical protein